MNRGEEDYIKTIYELTIEKKQDLIKSAEIALRFGFTDQSVNDMIKRLEAKSFVSFLPYKGIRLTEKGLKEAVRLIRRHRVWEVFLTQKLGFSWDSVHEDAEALEHVASDRVINELYLFLGQPKFCQHGNPIPNCEGHMEDFSTISIDMLNVGDHFKLTRVIDHKELLTNLDHMNISLYDTFEVISKDEFTGLIQIKGHKLHTISYTLAKMLFVSK